MPIKEHHPYSPDMLDAVVSRLETAANRLGAIRDLMNQREISELQITNHKEMVKGLKKVDAFVKAAEEAMNDYRLRGTLSE
jgi:hypothetical protein